MKCKLYSTETKQCNRIVPWFIILSVLPTNEAPSAIFPQTSANIRQHPTTVIFVIESAEVGKHRKGMRVMKPLVPLPILGFHVTSYI